VAAGPEGVCDGYLYEELGMAFAFYPDDEILDSIDCYPNFKIHGVGIGNDFSEIMEALGDTEIVETWLELPIYTVYMVRYRLGDSDFSFIAFEEDAPAHSLWIHQAFTTGSEDDAKVFARISGNTFSFLSGVGGWSTEVVVSEDGSFTGYFHDWDMGDIGDGYPEGTLYECYFSGKFFVTEMIDPYTYELWLAALDLEGETGVEDIAGGVRVISAGAYGIEGGDIFLLYCPGKETADLSEEFLEWMRMPNAWDEIPDALPFYGLHNVEEGTGFFSYADNLTGAWRTADDDDDEIFTTLLLYPADAFRLYQYHQNTEETFMLEGIRAAEGDVIIVSDIRLGILDAEGGYTSVGEKDIERFIFSLDLGDAQMLTIINEQGDAISLYPVDLDGPG